MILQLIDLRLDTEDAPERIKNIPVESLRLEHMGEDSEGALYWYFYGTRLYKEVKQRKKSKPKIKDEKQDAKTKKESKKTKKGERNEVTGDIKNGEEDLTSAPSWSLICQTESDWTKLAETLRKSKKKADKELFEVIDENFLPQVMKMLQEKSILIINILSLLFNKIWYMFIKYLLNLSFDNDIFKQLSFKHHKKIGLWLN